MIASSKDESSKSSKAVAFGRNYFHALAGGGGGAAAPAPTTGTATTTTDSNKKPSLAALDESLISSAGKGAADNNRPLPWVDLSLDGDDELSDIVQADASAQSTVFLTSSGKVYQTGTIHGHVYASPTRVTIPLPLPAIQVSCGRHFCVALMRGGVVVSWGAGHFGQLGIGASVDGGGLDNSAPAVDSQHASAAASLTFTATPVVVERLLPHIIGSPVLKLAAGDWHALALTQSGRVWAWGSNRSYQCGRKPSSSNTTAPTLTAPLPVPMEGTVADIAAGRSHSVALLSPGPSGSPLAVPSSLAPPNAGQVYAWGASQYGQCGILRRAGSGVVPPRMVEGLAEVTIERVAAAGNHNLALTSGGRVFGWGSSSEGELGLGVAVPAQVTPRLVGELDFCAILAGQEWKSQIKQQVLLQQAPAAAAHLADESDPSASSSSDAPTDAISSSQTSTSASAFQLAQVPRITTIACGPSYSAAISSSGHVYVWGSNDAGQLGIRKPPVVPIKDSVVQGSKTTSTNRDLHVQTFDSSHNVLLPIRLDAVRDMFVQHVACGPNHLWCVGNMRTLAQQNMTVGKTLYEMQEEQRMHKLQRARDSLLSKLHHLGDDTGTTTEGTTTQTDDNDTIAEPTSPSSTPASASHAPSSLPPIISSAAYASAVASSGSFGSAAAGVRTPSTATNSEPEATPASQLDLAVAELDVSTTDAEDTTHNASASGYGADYPLVTTAQQVSTEEEPTSSPTAAAGQHRMRRFSIPWRRFSFGARAAANSATRGNRPAATNQPAASPATSNSPPSTASPGGSFRRRHHPRRNS